MHVHDYVLESGDYFSREWQDKTLQNSALMLSIDASIVENEYLVETVGKCIVLRVVRSIVYHDRKESVLRSSTRYAWQLCKNDATGIRMIQGNQMQWHDHSFINPIPDGDWIISSLLHFFAFSILTRHWKVFITLVSDLLFIRRPNTEWMRIKCVFWRHVRSCWRRLTQRLYTYSFNHFVSLTL